MRLGVHLSCWVLSTAVVADGRASITSYGIGCPDASLVAPTLTASGIPAPGSQLTLTFDGGVPHGTMLLFAGSDRASLPMTAACSLLVFPLFPVPIGPFPLDANGDLSLPAALPSTLPVPFTLTLQAFESAPATIAGFAASNGLKIDLESDADLPAYPVRHFFAALGSAPSNITIADLNGDALPDLVLTRAPNLLTVFLGKGDGTLVTTTTHVVGTTPNSVVAADFDGDRDLDLATANIDSNDVSLLLNDGAGGFGPSSSLATGARPKSVAAGDTDGDGDVDLVVANSNSNDVRVFSGNGNGAFSLAATIPCSSVSFVRLCDLDDDADLDIVTVNYAPQRVHVVLNAGSGTFATPVPLVALGGPTEVAAGDLDGDSIVDLACTLWDADVVKFYRGLGGGAFAPPVDIPVADQPEGIALADLDGDSDLDLVTTSLTGGVFVSFANGAGGFGASVNHLVGKSPHTLAVADFDGDADVDIAAACLASYGAAILLNEGDGAYPSAKTYSTGIDTASVAIGDLNEDSLPDFVAGNRGPFLNDGDVSVLLADGLGGFGPSAQISVGMGAGVFDCKPQQVILADFTGDSHLDLVSVNSSMDSLSILPGDGLGGFLSPTMMPIATGAHRATVADFNLDSRLDLAVTGGFNPGNVVVLLGDGLGGFTPGSPQSIAVDAIEIVSGDFDGNGISDIAAGHNVASGVVSVLLGNGNGNFTPLHHVVGMPWGWHVAAGDFDDDGASDIATIGVGTTPLGVNFSNGTGGLSQVTSFPLVLWTNSLTACDFDGDQVPDLAVTHPSGLVGALLCNGNGGFAAPKWSVVGAEPLASAVSDLNGDGRPDLVTAGGTANRVAVLLQR